MHLLDSGAIYRVLALAALHHLLMLRQKMRWYRWHPIWMYVCVNQWQSGSDPRRGRCQRRNRTQEVANAASQVAAFPRVREHYCVANARFANYQA